MRSLHSDNSSDIRILFSHEIFYIQAWGGVLRGFQELAGTLHAQHGNCTVYAGEYCGGMAGQLKRQLGDHMIGAEVPDLAGRLHCNYRGERGLRRCIDEIRPTVMHRTQYNVRDLSPKGLGVVSTLHDTWTERDGRSFAPDAIRSHFKKRALERSDTIICVSQHTKNELGRIWPHLYDRSTVIYHGSRRISDNPVPYVREKPYFLYVGSREKRKNFTILLDALHASDRLRDIDLLCVGAPFSEDESASIARRNLTGRIIRVSADDDQLAGLYERAVALLYPSRFEGFGLPLLEAMHHRCPVISSPATCLAEIGGAAALYAAPDIVDEWVLHMEQVVFDDGISNELRGEGLNHAQSFSWERCAKEHMSVYRGF